MGSIAPGGMDGRAATGESAKMSALLKTRKVAKPWGRSSLPALFGATGSTRIGEVWFEPDPSAPQLLVKYIFTSEKLSVQVHPSDEQTEQAGLGRHGKEECWLVIDADPGARLGIGFTAALTSEEIRRAAQDGTIEGLMAWHPVEAGDFFYIPAGTVHAIGEGITLIEVQQNSDITYRLYDYGRARELHLDEGVAVARGEVYPQALHRKVPSAGSMQLVDGPHFRLDQVDGQPDQAVKERHPGPFLIIPRSGFVTTGGVSVSPGNCGLSRGWNDVRFADSGVVLIASAR